MSKTGKQLQEVYANRSPDMGIICRTSGERTRIAESGDAKADFDSTSFQLRPETRPNRERQTVYSADPSLFRWTLLKKPDYKDPAGDHIDAPPLLCIEAMEEYHGAEQRKVGKR